MTSEALPSDLPLGWTQVRRRKRSRPDDDEDCCEDASCLHQRALEQIATTPTSRFRSVSGRAIWLLHESNPNWMQGYFFVDHLPKPWGLLAVQQEVDDCLKCCQDGYQVLTVTLDAFDASQKTRIRDVEWKGGDMMQWTHPQLSLRTERLVSGSAAVPVARQLFGGLLRTVGVGPSDDLLEVFPELAVVNTTMGVRIPIPDDENDEIL